MCHTRSDSLCSTIFVCVLSDPRSQLFGSHQGTAGKQSVCSRISNLLRDATLEYVSKKRVPVTYASVSLSFAKRMENHASLEKRAHSNKSASSLPGLLSFSRLSARRLHCLLDLKQSEGVVHGWMSWWNDVGPVINSYASSGIAASLCFSHRLMSWGKQKSDPQVASLWRAVDGDENDRYDPLQEDIHWGGGAVTAGNAIEAAANDAAEKRCSPCFCESRAENVLLLWGHRFCTECLAGAFNAEGGAALEPPLKCVSCARDI
jgi:hypothetical protein